MPYTLLNNVNISMMTSLLRLSDALPYATSVLGLKETPYTPCFISITFMFRAVESECPTPY